MSVFLAVSVLLAGETSVLFGGDGNGLFTSSVARDSSLDSSDIESLHLLALLELCPDPCSISVFLLRKNC